MATLNLGRLKPVFRGAWNNATAYNVDDIVVRNNQSYISIQAGTNHDPATATAYWTLIAAKGSDGTDVGATLANKEIAFKTNAGAVDGIPIGNAGEFLKVNSGATGYEFGAVSSALLKTYTKQFRGGQSISGFSHASPSEVPNYNITITPQSTSSVFLIDCNLTIGAQVDHTFIQMKAKTGSGSYTHLGTGASDMYNNSGYYDFGSFYEGGDSNQVNGKSHIFYYAPATTSAITFALFCGQHSSTAYFGRSSAGSTDDYTALGMSLRVDEYKSTSELVNSRYTSG